MKSVVNLFQYCGKAQVETTSPDCESEPTRVGLVMRLKIRTPIVLGALFLCSIVAAAAVVDAGGPMPLVPPNHRYGSSSNQSFSTPRHYRPRPQYRPSVPRVSTPSVRRNFSSPPIRPSGGPSSSLSHRRPARLEDTSFRSRPASMIRPQNISPPTDPRPSTSSAVQNTTRLLGNQPLTLDRLRTQSGTTGSRTLTTANASNQRTTSPGRVNGTEGLSRRTQPNGTTSANSLQPAASSTRPLVADPLQSSVPANIANANTIGGGESAGRPFSSRQNNAMTPLNATSTNSPGRVISSGYLPWAGASEPGSMASRASSSNQSIRDPARASSPDSIGEDPEGIGSPLMQGEGLNLDTYVPGPGNSQNGYSQNGGAGNSVARPNTSSSNAARTYRSNSSRGGNYNWSDLISTGAGIFGAAVGEQLGGDEGAMIGAMAGSMTGGQASRSSGVDGDRTRDTAEAIGADAVRGAEIGTEWSAASQSR